jgi:acetate kinase
MTSSRANRSCRTLILNMGSTSFKASVYGEPGMAPLESSQRWGSAAQGERMDQLARFLATIEAPTTVAHRVVQSGGFTEASAPIDRQLLERLNEVADLAPLHMPLALAAIATTERAFPDAQEIAVFDSAFHASMPAEAAIYALPAEWVSRWQLRRHGFHGLSVGWSTRRTEELLGILPQRLVVCHLGGGCSVTAIREGRSMDTTMGFTPLEGLPMGSRCGSVDPGLLLHLLRSGMSIADLEGGLQTKSGLAGISGLGSDFTEICDAADGGNARASLAVAHFSHALRKAIGSMAGVLGGVDALVFTGGIGERSSRLRQSAAGAIPTLQISDEANINGRGDRVISQPSSECLALVITARENQAAYDLLQSRR